MATPPSSATPGEPSSAATAAPEKVVIQGQLRRLLIWMPFGAVGYTVLWGAIPGILLPLSVEAIDPANKVSGLALATSIGAIAPLIAQPVVGVISDRTRSRYGRRAPWLVIGALLTGLALIGMSLANGLIQLITAWVAVQFFSNFVAGPMSAVLPDRVPRAVRGTFSGLFGMGVMVGALIGSLVGAQFASQLGVGYFFFAGFLILMSVLFVVFNPDKSSKGQPREPFSIVQVLRGLWVNPIKHPDFFYAFMGRLLLGCGYYLVLGYQLYILQDYIGLGAEATKIVPLISVIGLGGTIISTLVGGPLSDRIGRRKIIVVIGGTILAASLLMPWFMPSVTGMMWFSLVSGIGFGLYQSVDTALISEVLPSSDSYGKDLGVVNIAAAMPQILGPSIAGILVLTLGGYSALFPIGAAIALVGSLIVLPIKSVR